MILSFFRNLRAKIIGAKVGHFVSLDRRGNLVDSGYGASDFNSPLPPVTSLDNGKVLKVVSGEWKANTIREVPSGGTTGQVLTRAGTDLVVWADPSYKYVHRVHIVEEDSSSRVIGHAFFSIITDSVYALPFQDFTYLLGALSIFLNTKTISANGIVSSGGNNQKIDCLHSGADYYTFYYYSMSSNGYVETAGIELNPNNARLSFTDDVTTV